MCLLKCGLRKNVEKQSQDTSVDRRSKRVNCRRIVTKGNVFVLGVCYRFYTTVNPTSYNTSILRTV